MTLEQLAQEINRLSHELARMQSLLAAIQGMMIERATSNKFVLVPNWNIGNDYKHLTTGGY